ncbi:MAG: hypothetical protein ABI759_06155 [Candidatus Solibacter sp.]
MRRTLCLLMVAAATALAQSRTVSFVSCPVVRDTRTAPCWLAEYQGVLYFLGVQGGVAQDFYPPQLNHEVLVEGVLAEGVTADGPRVCGGIPLQPVKTSVMLELNRACNTILPVEDGIEPPARGRGPALNSWARSAAPGDSTLFFEFDNDFLSLHATRALQRIAEYFQQAKAKQLEVTAYRGSSKLSNGSLMVEKPGIAAERAAKVSDILKGLGLPAAALDVRVRNEERTPDGSSDAWSRKVTLLVKP